MTKFCKYHNKVGHSTNDCIGVKNEMNRIIEKSAPPRPGRPDQLPREPSPNNDDAKRLRFREEIHVIREGVLLRALILDNNRRKGIP
ncbi:hypothetical protein M5689_009242 [Euphorbia peplus]|nr:hypothetical protein M5689_009242 [Euphorbia peplus]